MTSGRPVTEAECGRILELLSLGWGHRQIARRLDLHRVTVAAVIRDAALAWWRERRAEDRIEELRGRE